MQRDDDDEAERGALTRRELIRRGGAAGAALVLGGASLALGADAAEAARRAASSARRAVERVPRRALGRTGEQVPILLMGGAMMFDPHFDPKLAEALRWGVDYFDTADCYAGGSSETAIGAFHARAKVRDKLWITSKSDEHEPEGFTRTLERSLRRLRTDHVEMYFLHMLQRPELLSRELKATVERLRKAGKLKHFGFSCHHGNVAELLQHAAKLGWVEAVMFRYNFRNYGDAALNRAIDACVKAGVGLIAMKTQGSSLSFEARWQRFEQRGKWTRQQAVLKAVWADERISAAVSHMDSFEKLRANIAAALDRSKLGAAEHEALERYASATRALACDGCDHHCGAALAAPQAIGDTLRALMYHDVYGEPARARATVARLAATGRPFAGLDLQAATAACPHGLDLQALLGRAAQVLG
ncbi:MAG: aldo/keto reductase [Proteobacteria bacterium]|nr:aldo/keto reductase [Pseudomonadota bacterium]